MVVPVKPDPTFYRTPAQAMSAPAETLAYVVRFHPTAKRPTQFDQRAHQIHLEGGDASSDSYWFA